MYRDANEGADAVHTDLVATAVVRARFTLIYIDARPLITGQGKASVSAVAGKSTDSVSTPVCAASIVHGTLIQVYKFEMET